MQHPTIAVEEDKEFTAIYEEDEPVPTNVTVTATSSDPTAGTVAPEFTELEKGGSVQLTATLLDATNFEFIGWYENDMCISVDSVFALTNVQTDRTIEGRFRDKRVGIAVAKMAPDGSGEVSYSLNGGPEITLLSGGQISETILCLPGDVLKLTAHDSTGDTAKFAVWNSSLQTPSKPWLSTNATFEYTAGPSNNDLVAHYMKTSVRVIMEGQGSVALDGVGTVTPGTVYPVQAFSSVKLTATPAPGWKFDHWYGYNMFDGGQESTDNPVTIDEYVYSDTITAFFVEEVQTSGIYWNGQLLGNGPTTTFSVSSQADITTKYPGSSLGEAVELSDSDRAALLSADGLLHPLTTATKCGNLIAIPKSLGIKLIDVLNNGSSGWSAWVETSFPINGEDCYVYHKKKAAAGTFQFVFKATNA